jgi:hypothetical protein
MSENGLQGLGERAREVIKRERANKEERVREMERAVEELNRRIRENAFEKEVGAQREKEWEIEVQQLRGELKRVGAEND